jgi:hypothetical protein
VTTTRPAGSVAGDELVLFVIGVDRFTLDQNGSALYTGWSSHNPASGQSNSGQQAVTVFRRRSDGTSLDTPTLSDFSGGTSAEICWGMLALTGAQDAFDGIGTFGGGVNLTTQSTSSFTTTTDGSLLISCFLSQPTTPGAGRSYGSFGLQTPQVNTQQGAGRQSYFAIATEVLAVAGATGSRSATSSYSFIASDMYAVSMLAIKATAVVLPNTSYMTGGFGVDHSLIQRQLDHSRRLRARLIRDDDDILTTTGRLHDRP